MAQVIHRLFFLLSGPQKRKLALLQILVMLMAVFEIISILSILPFMALVGDINLIYEPGPINTLYNFTNISEANNFLIMLAILMLCLIFISSIFSMYTSWKLAMYGNQVGADIGNRLFKFFLHQPWLFHSSENSSNLVTKIAYEGHRITHNLINPILNLNAKLISILLFSAGLFIFNPMIAFAGMMIFGLSYYLVFSVVKSYLDKNGKVLSIETNKRYHLMSEGFGGIKDTLLLSRQSIFIDRFSSTSNKVAYAQGNNLALTNVPRYFIELVVLSTVILLILFLLINNYVNTLPIISVYALAGLKLLPGFQGAYTSISVIKANLAAFYTLESDLNRSQGMLEDNSILKKSSTSHPKKIVEFKDSIKFNSVCFSYNKSIAKIVKDFNLTIPKNKKIGIVGPSGSGKSTIIDILLGLFEPDEGSIQIDNIDLFSNIDGWQATIGYVPQFIYLSDCSIKENIAFGLPLHSIDQDKIDRALHLAHLDEFVSKLPDGNMTRVGEMGMQLSGGQRQRIGIARALYNNPDILVLDEATSSLDGLTEKSIMKSIDQFSGSKTIIIIAHRLATVKNCDLICMMENGEVADQGKFQDLILRNPMFDKMAKNS